MRARSMRRSGWSNYTRLRHLRIGTRLRIGFVCAILLMFLGSGIGLWHFRRIGSELEKLFVLDARRAAVVRFDDSLSKLMSHLADAAEIRDVSFFEAEAIRLLRPVQADTAAVREAVSRVPPDTDRQIVLVEALNTILDGLPSRMTALVELARVGDWQAVHGRLTHQVDTTDEVVSALLREIDEGLSAARKALLADVQQSQRDAARSLTLAGLLSLLAAAVLALLVTRSITRPLSALDAAARALARGEFASHVEAAGNDELAHLAAVFNTATEELQQLYAKIRHSEAHFRSLIENASDLILILTRTGAIGYASPASARVLGYAPDELVGRPIQELIHAEDSASADMLLAAAPSGKDPAIRRFEWRVRTKEGRLRWLEGVANDLLHDPAVSGMVINARDVTERRQAEQALRDREDQLRQAQKMEAIGRLAGGVAHDFNNLLTVINGYSDLLMDAADPGGSTYAYAKEVREAGERAGNLTRQLLAFSRKQMLQPQVVDLNEIVSDSERMLRRIIGEDVKLVCKLDPALARVQADPNQLHQVLVNLCANARDAMPQGGSLIIETGLLELAAPPAASLSDMPPGCYVVLAVSDTGHGMDEPTRQRVFEPFFTTKAQGKGTGLGLSTIYGIVRQSGGYIAVESAVDQGTTFRIYLPRAAQAIPASETKAAPAALRRGTETILLVEDQAEVRQLTSTLLRSFGYRVLEAGDGEEAIRLFETCAGPIHLLLTDVVMPGINGVELSRRLRALHGDLRVVFVSGYADSVLLRHAEPHTPLVLLQKPYTQQALAAKIREVLDSHPSRDVPGSAASGA